jgi:hypothetical protein
MLRLIGALVVSSFLFGCMLTAALLRRPDDPELHQFGGWKRAKRTISVLTVIGIWIYTALTAWILITANDTEVRQLRAYVSTKIIGLDCPSCNLTEEQAPKGFGTLGNLPKDVLRLTTKNSGLTPAYDLRGCVNWKTFRKDETIPADALSACDVSHIHYFPRSMPPGDESPYANPASVVDIIRAKRNEVILYIYGYDSYKDTFGYSRLSPFCYFYAPVGPGLLGEEAFIGCPEHIAPKEN